MNYTFIYVLIGVLTIVVFFYFIAPKLKLISYRSNIIRGILFFSMMLYLSYDFFIKEKYAYIIILALGTVGFIYMLINSKKR